MREIIPILKNEEDELPVPTEWRQTLIDIVEAFSHGDFCLNNNVDFVHAISASAAKRISGNIAAYGDELVSLSEETWDTSIYQWMRGYWEILVDLVMLDEGVSDLVMFVKVRENGGTYCFAVEDVHVP